MTPRAIYSLFTRLATIRVIFVGGVIRWIADQVALRRELNHGQRGRVENMGILVAAGLIAGEALMGLGVAGVPDGSGPPAKCRRS